jgi:hypothetical protein
MKRILSLSFAFCSLQAISQITVNSWQFLGPSEVVVMALDEQPSISHTPSGPNQTWDYGELNEYSADGVAFGPAQWFTGNQYFPNANFGAEDEGTSIFFRKNNEGFDLMGVYGDVMETGESMPITFSPYQRQIAFPMTYGQTWQNTSALQITITDLEEFGDVGDSLVVTVTTYRTGNVDGWGTLNTPLGTFDALRLHTQDSIVESVVVYAFGFPIFNESETTFENSYSFISNSLNSKYILVQYSYDPELELMSNVQWQMTTPVLASEDNASKVQPEIYPNPTTDSFKISNLAIGDKISILASNGQLVSSFKVSSSDMDFDVSNLSSGNYVVFIQGKTNVSAKKLSVQ